MIWSVLSARLEACALDVQYDDVALTLSLRVNNASKRSVRIKLTAGSKTFSNTLSAGFVSDISFDANRTLNLVALPARKGGTLVPNFPCELWMRL